MNQFNFSAHKYTDLKALRVTGKFLLLNSIALVYPLVPSVHDEYQYNSPPVPTDHLFCQEMNVW